MALTFNLGFDPKAELTKSVNVGTVDSSDYALKSETSDSTSYTKLTATLGRPQTLSYGRREIKDIYASSSIEPSLRSPSHQGIKLMLSSTYVGSLTSSEDPDFRADMPMKVTTVVDIPASDYISSDDVLNLILYHYGMVYGNGTDATSEKLSKLLRGALKMD